MYKKVILFCHMYMNFLDSSTFASYLIKVFFKRVQTQVWIYKIDGKNAIKAKYIINQ